MKLKYWALSLMACCGMWACSNDDGVANVDSDKEVDEASYLAVNVKGVTNANTRAGETFADGDELEYKVNSIRIYFFTSDGTACPVSGTFNFKDITVNMVTDGDNNITSTSDAVLVLEKVTGYVPHSMVAVVNPPADLTGNQSLAQLKALTADYTASGLTPITASSDGGFVMSNSVYGDDCEVVIGSHLRDSESEAKAAPVDVYVERVVAKVTVKTKESATKYLVSGGDTPDDDTDDLYAEIKGWTLIGEKTTSYLLKQIDVTWTNEGLGIDPWTSDDYHRSYWATSVSGNVNNSFKWSDINKALGTTAYTQENTPTAATDFANLVNNNLTKVIVATQLVDKDGSAQSRYEYLGVPYGGTNAIANLILPNFSEYWVKSDDTNYRNLTIDDVEFKTGTVMSDNDNSYRIYLQLKDQFGYNNDSKVYDAVHAEVTDGVTTINTRLKNYSAQVWTDGKAYYTLTIPHLATAENALAKYGIVRNHAYEIVITDISGFGTPVYNPDETISYPVVPTDDASYLAASINVLAWRVVDKSVILGN